MPHLLLHLRHVPDDEADEVRAMLDRAGIGFYETAPSRWGVSHGGIWLPDDGDIARAKALMAEYQADRGARARARWEQAKADGSAPGLLDVARQQPLRVAATLVAIVLLVALAAWPLWWFRTG